MAGPAALSGLEAAATRYSSYTYAFDNPIRFIDPDGMWPMPHFNGIDLLLAARTIYYSAAFRAASYSGARAGEQVYAANHPIDAIRVAGIASKASATAEVANLEPRSNRGDGSLTNAFRHTLGQAMATRELGTNEAKLAADAHEGMHANILQKQADKVTELRKEGRTVINAATADNFVDQLNNQTGRNLANSHPKAADLELANLTMHAISGQRESVLYRFKAISNSPNVLVMPAKITLLTK